jgi:hypothetical protein
MHKTFPVIELEIDSEIGSILKIGNTINAQRLPVGTEMTGGKPNRRSLNDWWTGRTIPASRDGIKEALQNMGVETIMLLVEKCYGLSLSDQYWFKPKGSDLKWEDVNFFQNDFSKDVGEILFGREPDDTKHMNLVSPDNTSDGMLRKKWIVANGKRILMKGANREFDYRQEPFNEIIASAIMRRLDISHAEYTLTFEQGDPYSLCENFITPDTELVPAWRIRSVYKKDNKDSDLTHLLRCSDRLEITGVREAIDRMLTVDYIIANRDRHWGNFGFVRDVNTLKWKGLSPIFDSGSSLWHNTNFVGRETESRPFRSRHEEQVQLVSDLSWFDYGALDGIEGECKEILSQSEIIDEARRDKIAGAVAERCQQIEHIGFPGMSNVL